MRGKPTRTPERQAWVNMHRRCTHQSDPSYEHYGGRGIKVCWRWHDYEAFRADMGPRPPGTSIERVNNDGDYEPGNCCWAARTDQQRNTTRNTLVTINGVTKSFMYWCEEYGIHPKTARSRYNKGMPVKLVFAEPVRSEYART